MSDSRHECPVCGRICNCGDDEYCEWDHDEDGDDEDGDDN